MVPSVGVDIDNRQVVRKRASTRQIRPYPTSYPHIVMNIDTRVKRRDED